jgi:hypothetical protein
MISQADKINRTLEQWIAKGCIDSKTELMCQAMVSVIKEQERTNLLLLELLNRTVKDDV